MKREETLKKEDVLEEVEFEISEDAFKGPFTCFDCEEETEKVMKKGRYRGIDFTYTAWQCPGCEKEYVDWEESSKLETITMIQNMLSDKAITMERNLNYDGNSYFFRFPKDLTSNWDKEGRVEIKVLGPGKFLVEVKA